MNDESNKHLVRVLGIKDHVLSFLSHYDIQKCANFLEDNYVVPSDLLVGCVGANGSFISDPKKLHNIAEDGYVIITFWDNYCGYYMRSILTTYNAVLDHPDIYVIDMKEEESGEHDFCVLKKIGDNQYQILLESNEHRVNDEWNDTDASFLTDDVISITYDVDDSNRTGCILYNLKTGKDTNFEYNSGLTFSVEDDKYLTYWSIGDYDDFGENDDDNSEQRRVDLETMEDICIDEVNFNEEDDEEE